MEIKNAVKSLSALAHDGRLKLVRWLITAGHEGVGAGKLAELAGIGPTTASAQLLVLSNAGLIRSRREGRHIIYFADYAQIRALMMFLLKDCCGNRAEILCVNEGGQEICHD